LLVSLLPLFALGAERPNVLFILVDDMGWKDIGSYGHAGHETPHLDKLAERGMRFTNAYAACPICGPSRAAIMMGKFPSTSGYVDNFVSQNKDGKVSRTPSGNSKGLKYKNRSFVKLEETILAEAFKKGGYQTGFLGKWHLTDSDEARLPTDQGFDVNIAGGSWGHPAGRTGFFSPYQMAHLKDGPKGEYLPDRLTSEAIRVMNNFAKTDKPWLLYMSYYTVHSPFHSKPEKTKKYAGKKVKNAKYAGMVDSLDENVGRLLESLDKNKVRDNTIVVFTSDNGGHVAASDIRPLRSYKGSLYEGGIRVPCIIDWPGVTKPGAVSETPIHGVDFYATLLAATGQPLRPQDHIDSVNLAPLLKGQTGFTRGPMVWHYPVGVPHIPHSWPGSVIRDGDYKYLHFYADGRKELYNLTDDSGETKNLVASMPEKAAKMKAQLDAMLKKHDAVIPVLVPVKRRK
jgi:arylsulfatase A-like enzyme